MIMSEINMEYSIVNAYDSIKGSDIKEWCETHKDNVGHEFAYHANNIYINYWQNENSFKPNPNAYYFVEHFVKYGKARWNLKRDKGIVRSQ